MALTLRFALPFGFAVGATVAYIKRSRARTLYTQAYADAMSAVSAMSWQEFEVLIGEMFRRRGFHVQGNMKTGPDGGIDLVLMKGDEKGLVQCKQWRTRQVGVNIVRELFGVMYAENAIAGYVVTAGSFSRDARLFATGRRIHLLDGADIIRIIEARKSAPTIGSTTAEVNSPVCPSCGIAMVERTAKRGRNQGGTFWGCKQYPRCRVTVPMANVCWPKVG